MENVVKKGSMSCQLLGPLQRKQWTKRFYVLYGPTSNSQARLDYYEDEAAYIKEPTIRKTIYIEEIKDLVTSEKGQNFNIELRGMPGKKDYLLKLLDKKDMLDWYRMLKGVKNGSITSSQETLPADDAACQVKSNDTEFAENDIYDSADKSDEFVVELADTESARRCDLLDSKYKLTVSSQSISISTHNDQPLYTWPYKYIRRYGRSKNSFTFEAGRKCSSGEGLFTIKTDTGDKIFTAVQNRTKSLKGKDAVNGSSATAPALPDRNYNIDSTLKSARAKSDPIDVSTTRSYDGRGPRPNVPPKPSIHSPTKVENKMPFDEINNKEDTPGPPLMKPLLNKNKSYPLGVEKVEKNAHNVAKKAGEGKNPVAYDLGKVVMAPKYKGEVYSQPFEGQILDANYRTVTTDVKPEPEYAIYDVRQSSRYVGNTPEDPMYDEPAHDDVDGNDKGMMNLMAELRNHCVEDRSQEGDASYDHLHVNQPLVRPTPPQRPLPHVPLVTSGINEYEDAQDFGAHAPPVGLAPHQEHLYDEVTEKQAKANEKQAKANEKQVKANLKKDNKKR